MEIMEKLLVFLNKLEKNKIFFNLTKIRDGSLLVEVTVPGQKWEIEFMEDGEIEIEKFLSDGRIFDKSELEVLFKNYSD